MDFRPLCRPQFSTETRSFRQTIEPLPSAVWCLARRPEGLIVSIKPKKMLPVGNKFQYATSKNMQFFPQSLVGKDQRTSSFTQLYVWRTGGVPWKSGIGVPLPLSPCRWPPSPTSMVSTECSDIPGMCFDECGALLGAMWRRVQTGAARV
jgi:hypothetical protein